MSSAPGLEFRFTKYTEPDVGTRKVADDLGEAAFLNQTRRLVRLKPLRRSLAPFRPIIKLPFDPKEVNPYPTQDSAVGQSATTEPDP
jgi:hypothetical protein